MAVVRECKRDFRGRGFTGRLAYLRPRNGGVELTAAAANVVLVRWPPPPAPPRDAGRSNGTGP